MSIIHINGKTIFGLSVRTKNQDETSQDNGKIARLVQKFDETVSVNYKSGARVYNVYYNYESDASGMYSVLVGTDKVQLSTMELQEVKIQEGNYLVFSSEGQVPQVVFETWLKIWSYFSSENCPHRRIFLTDFEFYRSQDEIEIHIGIE